MSFGAPTPVRRVLLVDGRQDWIECAPKDADAWYVEWGIHGKDWFHAIVDNEQEADELLQKCSFIG